MHTNLQTHQHSPDQMDTFEQAYKIELADRAEHKAMLEMLGLDGLRISYIWDENW